LEEANREDVRRNAEISRQQSEAEIEAGRREVQTAITQAASAAVLSPARGGGWTLKLNRAELTLSAMKRTTPVGWGRYRPAMDVIASAEIKVMIPQDQTGYAGREHSLWYADAKQAGAYGWYETAFMVMPLMTRPRPPQAPFSLDPGEEAGRAIGSGMADFQVAWPFTPVVVGDLVDFISRWAEWFANAAMGRLGHPSTMPERNPDGSWRR
jgi:serine/threonine-protein kinase